MFIPSNDAFTSTLRALGYTQLSQLAASQPALLTAVLQLHVVPGAALTEGAAREAGHLPTALQGQTLVVGRSFVEGPANRARITSRDNRVGQVRAPAGRCTTTASLRLRSPP